MKRRFVACMLVLIMLFATAVAEEPVQPVLEPAATSIINLPTPTPKPPEEPVQPALEPAETPAADLADASATSIFNLPTPTPKPPEEERVISFGVQMGRTPDQDYEVDNCPHQRYNDVTEEEFMEFGVILGERGYTVTKEIFEDNLYVAYVAKGDLSLRVRYYYSDHSVLVIYPVGSRIEFPDPFEGCEVLTAGEEVKGAGCRIKIGSVQLNNALNYMDVHAGNREGRATEKSVSTYIMGNIFNTKEESVDVRHYFTATLHFINEDGHYSYENWHDGIVVKTDKGYIASIPWTRESGAAINAGKSIEHSQNVNSLNGADFILGFSNVPDYVTQSREGTLAVTFDFSACGIDTPYVLYIRE